MIKLISELFEEGDYIRISLSDQSNPIVEGYILEMHTETIVLKTNAGTTCLVCNDRIISFNRGIYSNFGVMWSGVAKNMYKPHAYQQCKVSSQKKRDEVSIYTKIFEDGKLRQNDSNDFNSYCDNLFKFAIENIYLNNADVARFFLNLLFSIERSYEKNKVAIIVYLMTLCNDISYLLSNAALFLRNSESGKQKLIEKLQCSSEADILRKIMGDGLVDSRLENIFLMFRHSREILYKLTRILYEDDELMRLSLKVVGKFNIKNLYSQITYEEFVGVWERLTDEKDREYKQIKEQITAITNEGSNIKASYKQLLFLRELIKKDSITELDNIYIEYVVYIIFPALKKYLRASEDAEKKVCKHKVDERIDNLIERCCYFPTEFSLDVVCHLIGKVKGRLDFDSKRATEGRWQMENKNFMI